jgi:hypothetical protein
MPIQGNWSRYKRALACSFDRYVARVSEVFGVSGVIRAQSRDCLGPKGDFSVGCGQAGSFAPVPNLAGLALKTRHRKISSRFGHSAELLLQATTLRQIILKHYAKYF